MPRDFPHLTLKDRTHRLINSRWPTIGIFDDLADSEDELRMLFNLDMLTNARLNTPIGRLDRLPKDSIVTGKSAHLIMAAFVHCHEDGGRFNDGRLGVWYASLHVKTAIEETVHHLTKRLSLSEGGFPQQMQMRELVTTIDVPLLDLCGAQKSHPELYKPDDYAHSRKFATQIRWPFDEQGENGLCYNSVRHDGGINIGIFKPKALSKPVIQGDHYQYEWNAKGEIYIAKLTNIKRP